MPETDVHGLMTDEADMLRRLDELERAYLSMRDRPTQEREDFLMNVRSLQRMMQARPTIRSLAVSI